MNMFSHQSSIHLYFLLTTFQQDWPFRNIATALFSMQNFPFIPGLKEKYANFAILNQLAGLFEVSLKVRNQWTLKF